MLSGMLFVFLPLLAGYLVKIQRSEWIERINKATSNLVLVILGLMGLGLSNLDNIGQNLGQIVVITATFFVCIGGANILALPILDRIWPTPSEDHQTKVPLTKMMGESAKLILVVALGLVVGLFVPLESAMIDKASEAILVVLLLLIGAQLRNSGISLKQILLNPKGISLALVIVGTSLPGGLLAAWLLDLPFSHGLAMASGFGWYSLTGILISEGLGPVMGGAAFLNELLRELASLIIIPLLIGRYPLTSIGYAGATAMDFTLPIIQSTGGIRCVPVAIVSGFILSLLVPVLILFFISL
ncbi:lysine exporter LysO family protein [Parasalinivibrio latis]|uniref:lysine exporter LysO family protein n=1 Tax=Parasalinivibrio latis TaxID=2952610 RepID=UPI0030E49F93